MKKEYVYVPYAYFPGPWTAEEYQRIAEESGANFFALSGWLKLVTGLDLSSSFNSRTVFNIHPGPLPQFGGAGAYGRHVHEAVINAYRQGDINCSEVTMHFVAEEYDKGPVFFRRQVNILPTDTPATLARRVSEVEHRHQPRVTNLVVRRLIAWDGINASSLQIPPGYSVNC